MKKKNSKEVIQQSQGSSLVKNSREGMYDNHGNWNGSMMSDDAIENIQNEEEKRLAQDIDKLHEQIKTAREQGEDAYYISQLVQEVSRKYKQINELNNKHLDF